jgi:hypothetical protein
MQQCEYPPSEMPSSEDENYYGEDENYYGEDENYYGEDENYYGEDENDVDSNSVEAWMKCYDVWYCYTNCEEVNECQNNCLNQADSMSIDLMYSLVSCDLNSMCQHNEECLTLYCSFELNQCSQEY